MKHRISEASRRGTAITNYGMIIAYMQGVLKRATALFPDVHNYVCKNLET
jgi:hypothetical protein